MKKKIAVVSAFFLTLLGFLAASTIAKNESSCVTCHTNEAILRALCKVPSIPAGEGEG